MIDRIRDLIDRHAQLSIPARDLGDDQDLYGAGLRAFNGVRLLLAIEDAFEIEFPEAMLNRANFASIASIAISIAEIYPAKLRAFIDDRPKSLDRAA